jgi:hypothetical protein
VYHKTAGNDAPLVRLSVNYDTGDTTSDYATVYIDEGSTTSFDKEMDALKLDNTNLNIPGLYAKSRDDKRLSISAVPLKNDSDRVVPLAVNLEQNGNVQFTVRTLSDIPAGVNVYLVDLDARITRDLTEEKIYKVSLAKGKYENRFYIVFTRKKNVDHLMVNESLNAYTAGNKIFVRLNLLTGRKGKLVIRNTIGQKIYTSELAGYGRHVVTPTVSSGIYIVSFAGPRGVINQKVWIGSH